MKASGVLYNPVLRSCPEQVCCLGVSFWDIKHLTCWTSTLGLEVWWNKQSLISWTGLCTSQRDAAAHVRLQTAQWKRETHTLTVTACQEKSLCFYFPDKSVIVLLWPSKSHTGKEWQTSTLLSKVLFWWCWSTWWHILLCFTLFLIAG